MNTAQQFIVGILTLAIIAIMSLVVLGALSDVGLPPSVRNTIAFTNESTVTPMNYSRTYQFSGTGSLVACAATVTLAENASGKDIAAGNYTVADCTITALSTASVLSANNTVWNITGTYSHEVGRNGINSIINNTTNGISALFANATTWFILLGLVIIILIIGVVIGVTRGFGGVGTPGGISGGSSQIARI